MSRWQISGEQREAAKGAELLLSAIILHQYCNDDDEEDDGDTLQVGSALFLIEQSVVQSLTHLTFLELRGGCIADVPCRNEEEQEIPKVF